MKRVYLFLKVFSILLLIILPTTLNSVPQYEKHIVVIHSFYSELTANREIDKSIENYVRNISSPNIYIHTIYLDASNIFSLAPTRIARRTLRKLELFEQIDGFIIIGKPAFNTMIKDEFRKFGNTPTIFLSNSDLVIKTPHFFTNYLCINKDINVAPTLTLALDLFPSVKRIEIIANSSSPIVERNYNLIRQNLSYFTKMNVSFIPDMNLTEYGEYISSIKEETIILLSEYVFSDEPHRVNDNDLAFYLTKNPNLKVFTTHKHQITNNFIGGFVVDFQKLGLLSITTLFDLINHKRRSSYDEVIYMSNQYFFNRTALKSYNIPIEKLPSNYRFTYKYIGKRIRTIHYLIALLLLTLTTISLFLLLYKKLSQNDRYREELIIMQKLLANMSSKLNLPYWYHSSPHDTLIKSHNLKSYLGPDSENINSAQLLDEFLNQHALPRSGKENKPQADNLSKNYQYFRDISQENSFGFINDVSEINSYEERLNKTNHLNRILLKSINQAVISISDTWEIKWYNQATIDLIITLTKVNHDSIKHDEAIANLIFNELKLKLNFKTLIKNSTTEIHLQNENRTLVCKIIPNNQQNDKQLNYLLFINEKAEAKLPATESIFSDKLSDFFSSFPNYSAWSYQESSNRVAFSNNFSSIIDKDIDNYSFPLQHILENLDCFKNKDALNHIQQFLKGEIETLSIELVFRTINDESKLLKVKGKRFAPSKKENSVTAIGFLKDITAEMKVLNENSELKEKIKQQLEIHNKELFTLRQEFLNDKEELRNKLKKLSSEKSYIEANLDFLVQQGKMTEIESLIRGISNEFNEPLSVLKLSNETFLNEIDIMLENLTTIIPLLSETEITLLSSITEKIISETIESNFTNPERVEDIIPSLRNMEEMEFATISNVSKLIVNIGLQANLKAIRPLISHQENEKILSFLMTIKNLVKLKHNINFDLENLTRIAYSLRRFVETSNPKTLGKCDLVQLIHKTLSYFKYQIEENTKIELSLPPKLEIICNPDDFIIFLSNILQNSLDAIDEDEKGLIKIGISDFDNRVVLRISDNGIGIDDKSKQHLFEPFYTTKTAGKRIGLGLVIAKKITDNHKAQLEIDSSSKGTIVSIYLNKRK